MSNLTNITATRTQGALLIEKRSVTSTVLIGGCVKLELSMLVRSPYTYHAVHAQLCSC